MQRTIILVDDANFCKAVSNKGRYPDLVKLRQHLDGGGHYRMLEMIVYMGVPPSVKQLPEKWQEIHDSNYSKADKLRYEGMIVVQHPGKEVEQSSSGERRFEANVDMVMALDALEFATRVNPDTMILVTGDRDFADLANRLRRRGIRVEAASLKEQMSHHLLKAVNEFIDLEAFVEDLPAKVLETP